MGFFHTLIGPDHYLPFVAMARIGRWSLGRTLVVTLLCGVGHVAGSVAIGFIGIACGAALFKMESIEAFRAELAGWLLLAFGLTYLTYGLWRAIRNRPHSHVHVHDDGTIHTHLHTHTDEHLHVHASPPTPDIRQPASRLSPWVLFTIFLFGPCEPLIPFLMYPAAQGDYRSVALVAGFFGAATLATMTAIVVALYLGAAAIPFARFHRYAHAMAGLVIVCCGAAVRLGI
jgi:nickel/cobalt transporter (NicO) family protein